MMPLKEYTPLNQACLADYLPWALIVAPGVVEHKDGALQKTFAFRGHDLDSATSSSKRHKITTPDMPMYIDHILSDESIEHGLELKVGDNFVRTLSIKAFPGESFPGMLDAINDLNFPFRWSTRFIAMSTDTGKAHIETIRRVWYAGRKRIGTILKEVASQSESALGESSSLRKSEDADEASQLLDEGVVSFGFFTATISVWATDSKSADDKIHQVASVINRLGFNCHLETLNACDLGG